MKPICFLFLFTCICALPAHTQSYLTLTGKVLDQKTRKPIPYAHVGIPEKGIGTTTSYDGSFQFIVPEQYANSSMIVSYMGYQTYEKPIRQLKNPATIYIEQYAQELSEVVVMGQNAIEDIIRKAVRKIPDNYPTQPTTVLGFYRESRTDDSLHYIYMAEGVLDIYKNSYKSSQEGQVGLVQGRKINLKNPLDTVVNSGFSSGHMAAHRFDFVKNREDFIDETYFSVYKYWIEKITYYNDRPVFVIGFDKDEDASPKDRTRSKWKKLADTFTGKKSNSGKIEARMKGRLFIDQESYAFIRAEFEITPEGLKKWDDYPLYAGSWKANKYVANYRKVGDTWYFSDALREGQYARGGLYVNDIKITEINPERSKPIPYLERMSRGQRFVRMITRYDEDFWKNYNTTPLSEGLAESVQQYQNMQKAQEVFDTEYMASLQRQRDSIQAIQTLEIKEQIAQETGRDISDISDMELPEEFRQIARIRRNFSRVRFMFGAGTHLLETHAISPLSIAYIDGDSQQPFFQLTKDVPAREREIIAHWDFDIFLKRHLFIRFGHTFDFYDSFYKDWSVGAGTQVNLSNQRPVFFRALAQYSYLRYARKVGDAKNEYGDFKIDGKKFNAESIRTRYGSRLHNLKLTAELSIELNPDRELFLRGSYFRNFAHGERLWFRERNQLFNKRARLPADNNRLVISSNDVTPFMERLTPETSFAITVGLYFK